MTALIENFDVETLIEISLASLRVEGGRRFKPYSVFKWMGRRFVVLSRALLASLVAESRDEVFEAIEGRYDNILSRTKGKLIFDPFCGGGTIAIEASFMGYNSVCQDINTAAIYTAKATYEICRSELCTKYYEDAYNSLLKTFDEMKHLWCVNDLCFLHVFASRCDSSCKIPIWVSTIRKNGVKKMIIINEEGKLEYIDYNDNIKPTYPFFEVSHKELVEITKNVYAYAAEIYNLNTGKRFFVSLLDKKDKLSGELANELSLMYRRSALELRSILQEQTPIPSLSETKRLYRINIKYFEELFSPRQLLTLIGFVKNSRAKHIATLIVANVMRTSSLLAIYYQPYAKVNPALVIKSFWFPQFPVELNPMLFFRDRYGVVKSIGRGTIATYLRELYKVCENNYSPYGNVKFSITDSIHKKPPSRTFAVVTDPPYIGKQSYRDLSILHLYSLKLAGINDKLNVPNDIHSQKVKEYVDMMKKFAKNLQSLPKGSFIVMLQGIPSSSKLKYITEIIENFVLKGFKIRNLYWVLGESPGILGRSPSYGVLILVLRKDDGEHNMDNINKMYKLIPSYKRRLKQRLSMEFPRIAEAIRIDYEFSLYKKVIEDVLKILSG